MASGAGCNVTIHSKCKEGDLKGLLVLCAEEGVDIDAKDESRQTALHVAVSNSFLDGVRGLLCLGANPNLTDANEDTPLHFAAMRRSSKFLKFVSQMDIVESLRTCGAQRCPTEKLNRCSEHCKAIAISEQLSFLFSTSKSMPGLMRIIIDSCIIQTVGTIEYEQLKETLKLHVEKGMDIDAQDWFDGRTALHMAVSDTYLAGVRVLLQLGANPNVMDPNGNTPLDLVIKLASDVHTPRWRMNDIMTIQTLLEEDSSRDLVELMHSISIKIVREKIENCETLKNLLALDGGGIKGLALIQILIALEEILGEPVWQHFHWVAATSTGSLIAAALATGKSLRYCQRLYLRLKDRVFTGYRPYSSNVLENLLKEELGAETTLDDIKEPKLVITCVRADTDPISLERMRNYQFQHFSPADNCKWGYSNPKEQKVWKALLCSSAAPTYFPAVDGKYVDGGLIANNPSLMLLSELQQWNSALEVRGLKVDKIGIMLSMGNGRIPDIKIQPLEFNLSKAMIQCATSVLNLGKIFLNQVTAVDGAQVDQAQSWCHSLKAPFFRMTPPLSKDIRLDSTDDANLVNLMWDAVLFTKKNHKQLSTIAELLKLTQNEGMAFCKPRTMCQMLILYKFKLGEVANDRVVLNNSVEDVLSIPPMTFITNDSLMTRYGYISNLVKEFKEMIEKAKCHPNLIKTFLCTQPNLLKTLY